VGGEVVQKRIRVPASAGSQGGFSPGSSPEFRVYADSPEGRSRPGNAEPKARREWGSVVTQQLSTNNYQLPIAAVTLLPRNRTLKGAC